MKSFNEWWEYICLKPLTDEIKDIAKRAKELTGESEVKLCGHSHALSGQHPCELRKGHKGPHYSSKD